jgi:S1-C subfamily serine protease
VAFIRRFVEAPAAGTALPALPPIIGTGFVVHHGGLIVTNRHVVEAFGDAPSEILEACDGPPVMVAFLQQLDDGIHMPCFAVAAVHTCDVPQELLTRFSPEQPDVAFVQIRVRGLQSVLLDGERSPLEGMELATSGFSMGTDALMPNGYVAQLSPTLQTGVVSAVLPFPSAHPHGFLMNAMVRGGASGSPVFFPDTGAVSGIVCASLTDFEVATDQHYRVPTNLTYVVPARVIVALMDDFIAKGRLELSCDAPDFGDLLRDRPTIGAEVGFPWEPLP